MISFLRWVVIAACITALFFIGLLAAHAENNAAASYLGMCSKAWPCQESLRVFDGLPVKRVRWLAETFGRTCSCPRKFLQLPGKKEPTVHLANGTCFPERGRQCAKGEPFFDETIWSANWRLQRKNPRILRKYRVSLLRTKKLLRRADSDTTVYLSLCLECPLSSRARRSMLAVAEEVFPGGRFVDSVLTQKCLKGLICEKHGAAPRVSPPCMVDTDGLDFRAINVPKFLGAGKSCLASGLWTPPFNLLDPRRRSFQLPLQRATPPTRADFKALRRWLRR